MAAGTYILPPNQVVMGILNVTPDSFSDGGRFVDLPRAVAHAQDMLAAGAQIIDVGGESTRPGAEAVPASEQIRRTAAVIAAIRQAHPAAAISIDTRLAEVARCALDAGAAIVNDISALRDDPQMADLVAARRAGVVLMHMQGRPQSMQMVPHYRDVVAEVEAFLQERVTWAVARGIDRARIVIDPGIGFGKTPEHNLRLLSELRRFTAIAPVLLGTSRKSFIGHVLGVADPASRLTGTTVTHAVGLLAGARILRAHDVLEACQTVRMIEALGANSLSG